MYISEKHPATSLGKSDGQTRTEPQLTGFQTGSGHAGSSQKCRDSP